MLPSGISMDLEIMGGWGVSTEEQKGLSSLQKQETLKEEGRLKKRKRSVGDVFQKACKIWSLEAKVLGNGLWQSPIQPTSLWSCFFRLTGSSLVWTFWHTLMPACQAPPFWGNAYRFIKGRTLPWPFETALINSTFVLLQFFFRHSPKHLSLCWLSNSITKTSLLPKQSWVDQSHVQWVQLFYMLNDFLKICVESLTSFF